MIRRIYNSPTLSTWAALFVRMAGMLLLTPLIVSRFDPSEIALWYLFASIMTLGTLADFGFTPTLIRLASYAAGGTADFRQAVKVSPGGMAGSGQVNWQAMQRLFEAMKLIYAGLAVALLLALALIGTQVIRKPIADLADPAQGWMAWAVVVIATVINFSRQRWVAMLQGLNHVAKANQAVMVGGGLATVGAATVILAGGGFLLSVAAYQCLGMMTCLLQRAMLKRVVGSNLIERPDWKWDAEVVNAAWPAAWRSALGIAFSTGVTNVFGLLYAQLAKGEDLAAFLMTSRLMGLAAALSQAPFYSKVPRFSALRAQAAMNELAESTSTAMIKSLVAFIFCAALLVLLGDPVLRFIGSKVSLLSTEYLLAWSVVFLMERHHAMHAQVYSTTNHIPFHVPIIVTGTVNLLLVWLLLPSFGVWAFVVGHGASNLLINNWWNVRISVASLPLECRSNYLAPGGICLGGVLIFAMVWAIIR